VPGVGDFRDRIKRISAFKQDIVNEFFSETIYGVKFSEVFRKPEKVSITESDTWAHNAAIGKSNICINVETTPPQAFISAGLTGPGNYTASLPKTPLHPDGTRQVARRSPRRAATRTR